MKFASGLKIGAEALLGAIILMMLYISLNEIASGIKAGIGLLVPIAVFIMFMWLAWNWPWETGLSMVLLGVIVIIIFRITTSYPIIRLTIGSLLMIAGLCLLGAGWKPRHS